MLQDRPTRLAPALASAEAAGVPIGSSAFTSSGPPQFPLAAPHGSLRDQPRDATYLRLNTRDTRHLELLPEFAALEVLVLIGAREAHLEAAAQLTALRVLCLIDARTASLEALAGATLRHLTVAGARKLTSLAALPRLQHLSTASAVDIPRVAELPSFGDGQALRGLELACGFTSKLTLRTLAPLSDLQSLEHLTLRGARARDDSLRPLHALRGLRHLSVSWVYPLEQLAALRAAFPRLVDPTLEPYIPFPLACDDCGGQRVKLSGRGGKVVCTGCAPERVARFVATFEELVSRGPGAAW